MKYDFVSNFKCSGRWREGRCAIVVKSLSSNHTLKLLFPTFFLLLMVIYGLADKLRNFVAGVFVPQYHYPYPVGLCFAQVLVSLFVLNLLHVLNMVPLKHYSRPLGEKLLLPAICNSLHSVMVMWAKACSTYNSLFLLTQPLLAPITAGFSFALKLSSPPSVHISVLISILSGTSIVITAHRCLPVTDPLDYMYAPLALILHSLSLTWLSKVSESARHHPDAQVSVFDIYYTQLVNQSWVLGLLWLLHPHSPWQVLSQGSWHSLLFCGYLLAILLLGMVLNFLLGMMALCVSPIGAAVLHCGKPMVQPFFQLL